MGRDPGARRTPLYGGGAWIGSLCIACPTVVSWGRSCPTEFLHPAPSGGWEPLQPLSAWAYPACLTGLGVDCKAELDQDEGAWVRTTVLSLWVLGLRLQLRGCVCGGWGAGWGEGLGISCFMGCDGGVLGSWLTSGLG